MRRPRVKPEHTPYRTRDGHIRIAGTVYGLGVEIEDPDGWIWTLVRAADGTRSPREVRAAVTAAHPHTTDADAAAALEALAEAGHLDDADGSDREEVTDRDRERYSRSLPLHRWMDPSPRRGPWDVQAVLKGARVLLVGVGGTGGTVAQALTASGVGRLHLVDPDTVELSNLNRQVVFRESDIGRPKAEAAAARLRSLNGDVTVTAERRRVRGVADLAALLARGWDLLALCADEPAPVRRWANRACLASGTPWVTGGYHGPVVTAGIFDPACGPCWECVHDTAADAADLRLPDGVTEADLRPRLPVHPVTAVSAMLSGTLVAHAATAALTGVPALEPGSIFGVNLVVPGDPVLERHPRREGCQGCGGAVA